MIKKENQNELISQIIDIFEDFLDDTDNSVIAYSSDYEQLQEKLLELLKA